MHDAALVMQKALLARIAGAGPVTALVPVANILDTNQRPAPDPSIILGEDQVVNGGITIKRNVVRVYSTLHIWKKEPGLAGVKAIAGAVSKAIGTSPIFEVDAGYACTDAVIETFRAMRDPDGERGHGILTINSLVRVPA